MSLRLPLPTVWDIAKDEKNIEELHFMKVQIFQAEKQVFNTEDPFRNVKLLDEGNLVMLYEEEIEMTFSD